MENQTYNISSDMATRNSLVVDGISPHTTLNSLVQSYLFDQTSDFHVTNQAENVVSSDAFYAYKRNVARDASLGGSSAAANREFEETPDSAVSIASFVAAKYGLQENLNNLAISVVPSIYSSEVLADYVPNDCSIASNPRFPTPVNCGNDEVLGMINGQWDMQKYRTPQFSQVILGSRYLCAVQEILAQIASFSLENVDHSNYFKAFDTPCSSNFPEERGLSLMDPSSNGGRPEGEIDPALHRRAMKTKKAKLLALLQMVDDCYNQCLDEIHTVISAFHAATELDPQIHARFALQTISTLYKSLRERISNHCLAMGSSFDASCSGDTEKSFESSFVQKQWALQQLKKKEHQLWRPQRGLPERSVSVLRAWMFQNFLHPYPKDAEKHLLAVRSGLTRNQVSNWFINARVRLWKPMIEEMYAEMNRRKSRRNDNTESSNNNQINHTTSTNNNQRYHHVN